MSHVARPEQARPMNGLASRSVRGALFLTVSTVSNIVVGFLGGILLARLLSPNDFGTLAVAVTAYAFLDLRTKLQLEQKYLREPDDQPEFFDTFVTLNLLLAALSLLPMLLGALVVWRVFQRGDLGAIMVVVGVASLVDSVSGALRFASEKHIVFGRVALFQTIVSLTQFGITLAAALAGLGLWSLALGLISSALLNLALFWTSAVRRPLFRLDRALARSFLAYGLRYGLVFATASVILTQFDTLVVGLLAGTAIAGHYDRAYRTSLWPTLLISASLARISLPAYAQLSADPPRLRRAFALALWVVVAGTAPAALLFVILGHDLVWVVYGPRWLPAAPILQWLGLFALFRPLWDNLVAVLLAMRQSRQLVRLVSFQAIVLVFLAAPLTYFLGGQGTAISVGIAFLIASAYLLYYGRVHLQVDVKTYAVWPLANALLSLGPYLALRWLIPLQNWLPWQRLVVTSALLLASYALFSLVTTRQVIAAQTRLLLQALRG